MEKVKTVHSGSFTLRGYGLRTGDSKFFAAFLVTEHRGKTITEIKDCSTGDVFDLEVAAVEAGFAAAAAWLEDYRPLHKAERAMARDPEGLKTWRALRDQWRETHQAAVEGRAQLMKKQIACAAGKGPDPAVAEIEAVEKLERTATKLAVEMDNFVTNRLG